MYSSVVIALLPLLEGVEGVSTVKPPRVLLLEDIIVIII